jgi:putative endonuclease
MTGSTWTLYLLRNERGALYTGITTDLERRLSEHRGESRKGARYTRACKNLDLVFSCAIGDRSAALKAEARIKKLRKAEKEELVSKQPDRDSLLNQLMLV